MLAAHPRVAEKLLEEIEDIDCRSADLDHVACLPYLDAVVKEGMRIASGASGIFITRRTVADMTLMGYRIPKGTALFVPPNRWMDSEEEWGDPEAFRPERWINGEVDPRTFFLGFSFGARECPGQKLALMEINLALIKLVQRYKFSTDKYYVDLLRDAKNGFAIEARGGMWLRVEPRR